MSQEAAKTEANNDHRNGMGSPNTNTWNSQVRDTYLAERERLAREEANKK